jgi:hypothetical protein
MSTLNSTLSSAGSASRPLIGFLPALALIFAAAKVFGFISWSWWLVLLPAYLPVLIGLVIFALCLLVGFLLWMVSSVILALRNKTVS